MNNQIVCPGVKMAGTNYPTNYDACFCNSLVRPKLQKKLERTFFELFSYLKVCPSPFGTSEKRRDKGNLEEGIGGRANTHLGVCPDTNILRRDNELNTGFDTTTELLKQGRNRVLHTNTTRDKRRNNICTQTVK